MASKLIFEDEAGLQHEIKLETVKMKGITENDVVLAKYEVGDIQEEYKDLASHALTQLKNTLESVFPDGVKVVVVATKNGKEDVDIKILKNKIEKYQDA